MCVAAFEGKAARWKSAIICVVYLYLTKHASNSRDRHLDRHLDKAAGALQRVE